MAGASGGTINNGYWCERLLDPVKTPELLGCKGPCCDSDNSRDSSSSRDSPSATPNPITHINGNKYLGEEDVNSEVLGGLSLSRHYNGLGGYATLEAGAYWKFNLDRSLSFETADMITAYRPDGRQINLVRTGNQFKPSAGGAEQVYRILDLNGSITGWRYTDAGTGLIEDYDPQGRLTQLTNAQGQTWTLTRDKGRVVSVANAYGTRITLGYDTNYRLGKLTLPDGSQITYGYATNGTLTSVTYPDGKIKTYGYNEAGQTSGASLPGALTSITDENGIRYITYTYDNQGRAIAEILNGNVGGYTLTYNTGNTVVKDPLGTPRTYNYKTVLGVARSSGQNQPGGAGCAASANALTYDTSGNIASRTDFNGNQTTYTHDTVRNLETKRVEAFGKPEARTITTQWHAYWNRPVKIAEPKKRTTYVYNGDNGTYCAPVSATVPRLTGGTQPIAVICNKTEQATTDLNGSLGMTATATGAARTWKYTYNAFGQILTLDGPRTDTVDVTTYTYYSATDPDMGKRGKLATITNALGHVTQITAYDLNGNPQTIIDPNGVTTQLTYDLRQRLTSRSVGGETTSYQYDGVGQLLKVTLPDGSYTAYTYDNARRLTEMGDALGNRIVYTLDAMGNRTKEDVKDPSGQLARTRSRIFDALSRLAQDIGAQGQITRYEYDANGNRTKATDPLNQVTASSYDALNRLIQITDPGLGQTRYGYDGQSRLTQVTDPRNLATTYTFDGLGNPSAQQSPDTGSTVRTFDAAGNELTRIDAKAQRTTTTYDALNRPTRVTHQDGSRVQYVWDTGSNGLGRLSRIDEYNTGGSLIRSLVRSYDGLGRIIGETRIFGSLGHNIGYSYSAGQLSSLTLPSTKQLGYTRNPAGQITQVTLTASGQTQILLQNIAYHPFGGIKSFADGAGQIHSRGSDQDGRTSSYTLGNQTWMLSYDAASRIAGIIDAGNAGNSATYGYDGLDRLTQTTLPATTYSYTYDATGNRISQTSGGTTRGYTTDSTSNRLSALTNPAQTLSHDANGSLIGDGSATYTYDTRGRLGSAVTAAGTTTYQINALGQRVRKTNSTTNTDVLYHYDLAGHLIAESNASGTLLREYVWLGDIPVAVLQ